MSEFRRNNSHLSVCNRLMVEKIIPQSIKMYNNGRFGNDYYFFEERDYYKNVFDSALSKSISEEFVRAIKIERGNCRERPNLHILSLTLPHNNEIGDTEIIGVIIDKKLKYAVAYCMEKSLKDYMICQWMNDKHYNYGSVSKKTSFFSAIVKMATDEFEEIGNPHDSKPHIKNTSNSSKCSKVKSTATPKRNFLFLIIVVLLLCTGCYFIGRSRAHHKSLENSDNKSTAISEPKSVIDNTSYHEGTELQCQDSEYERYVNNDELLGETFCYNPEDGTIKTSSGKIVSPGYSTQAKHETKEIYLPNINEYEGVEIEHFLNGAYPYASVYGNGKFDNESLSKLSISNQSATDAVVLLCDAKGDVIRNVLVKQKSVYEMVKIPNCRCIIKIMYGNDWYKEKDNGSEMPKGGFTKNVSYSISKWSDVFDFTPRYVSDGIDYPTYEITLHAVPNGNFQTNRSNKNEFFSNKLNSSIYQFNCTYES